jgi:hypothetical protein
MDAFQEVQERGGKKAKNKTKQNKTLERSNPQS